VADPASRLPAQAPAQAPTQVPGQVRGHVPPVVPGGSRARGLVAALVGMVVVAALVATVHLVVVARAEARIAREVAAAVGVPVQAQVGGVLAGFAVLADRIPHLTLTAEGVPVGEGPSPTVVEHLEVVVEGLVLRDDVPVAGSGRFTAALTQAEVRAASPPDLAPLLALEAGELRIGAGPLSLPLGLEARGDALVVTLPGGVPGLDGVLGGVLGDLGGVLGAGLAVPLDVPAGVSVTGAAVLGDRLVLTGPLDPVVVSAG
jgi:hypothetical protein